jgi:hypothetical protein
MLLCLQYDECESPEGEEDAEIAAWTDRTHMCKTKGTPAPPPEVPPPVGPHPEVPPPKQYD